MPQVRILSPRPRGGKLPELAAFFHFRVIGFMNGSSFFACVFGMLQENRTIAPVSAVSAVHKSLLLSPENPSLRRPQDPRAERLLLHQHFLAGQRTCSYHRRTRRSKNAGAGNGSALPGKSACSFRKRTLRSEKRAQGRAAPCRAIQHAPCTKGPCEVKSPSGLAGEGRGMV